MMASFIIILVTAFQIAKKCIGAKTDMVTASYLTDPMKALHEDAVQAGVTIVNEVGKNYLLLDFSLSADEAYKYCFRPIFLNQLCSC